jgi:hypothetical protein
MPQPLRVFISSPGDVRDARATIASAVERIASDYAGHFTIEPYLWETEALLASGHFQDAIEAPSAFDIVTLILWSRLGTLMPERTAVRRYVGIDGRSPLTGTEWEFEDALASARDRGVPDILVYRNRSPALIDAWDAHRRDRDLAQLSALDGFWRRHFVDGDRLISAFHEFQRLETLASLCEAHLRRLVERRIDTAAGSARSGRLRARSWPKAPFRGLAAFDHDDAPIFFGREAPIAQALAQLIDNASRGRPFLLVLGASGSGKSSLARAGVAPRLAVPRRVIGKRFLRRAVFEPGARAGDEDLMLALARAVVGEGKPGVGLPELPGAASLAGLMRDAPGHAASRIAEALDKVTLAARAEAKILAHEEAVLLLVLDPLETLFTDPAITQEDLIRIGKVVRALCDSGRIWVLATMRSDLWRRVADSPELMTLAAGQGRYDLPRPGLAEIGQMIRLPAEAAGLGFEAGPIDAVPLNDRIAEAAAAAPGALPLLSYLLEQIHERDAVEAGGGVLTYATYEALGGLRGAIAARAEAIFSQQPAEARSAFNAVLFSFVQTTAEPGGTSTVSARRCPLATFPEGGAARRLVDALLSPTARLLVADDDARGGATVRLAHEALLVEWTRASEAIDGLSRMLSIRQRVEQRHARWSESRPRKRRWWALAGAEPWLLDQDDLAEAGRLLRDHRGQLSDELAAYIQRSRRVDRARRRRVLVIVGAFAASMAALAAIEIATAYRADVNAARARDLAERAVALEHDSLLYLQSGGLHDLTVNKDPAAAILAFDREAGSARQLIGLQPREPLWRLDLAVSEAWKAYAMHMRDPQGNQHPSQALYRQALRDAEACAEIDSQRRDVARNRAILQQEIKGRLREQP